MSADNQEPEDMEVDAQDSVVMHAEKNDKQAEMASSQKESETLMLSLKWLESDQQSKMKMQLQKALQTWFNTNKLKDGMTLDCSVKEILGDGSAVIKMDPPSALTNLPNLKDETLTTKDGIKVAIIQSVIVVPPKPNKQPPDDVSGNSPSSSDKPADKGQLEEQSDTSSAAGQTSVDDKKLSEDSIVSVKSPPSSDKPADKGQLEEQSDTSSGAGQTSVDDIKLSEECIIPVSHYWYISQAYKEEIKRIEKQNKVKLKSHVIVKFEAEQEDGTPAEALSDFTDLIQKCLPESNGSVVPLKYVDPDQWSEALKTIKKNENKVLVTMTTDKMTVCGPKQSKDAFSATIYAMQKTNVPAEEDDFGSRSPLLKIKMTIRDNLTDTGLTMEEDQWNKMLSFHEKVAAIKSKFNVDFKESNNSQGKVRVKAVYNGAGGNAAMESHAVRALLQLCQKTLTTTLCLTQPHGATGFNLSQKNFDKDYQSGEASNGPELNGNSSQQDNKAASGEDSEEERCPICLDSFTNKKRLKCKHEFCDKCLQETKKHQGPICPICKAVFGLIEGDQPDGTMRCLSLGYPLPGFPGCGHIVITYDIPSGMQTKKHPKPGQLYSGLNRQAYLPDNKEGNEVLRLLKKAFNQRLIFTVGTSRTTGLDNQVTWNDIHHKTSPTGGPGCFGYPDPDYLSRVKEELKAKGIE